MEHIFELVEWIFWALLERQMKLNCEAERILRKMNRSKVYERIEVKLNEMVQRMVRVRILQPNFHSQNPSSIQ